MAQDLSQVSTDQLELPDLLNGRVPMKYTPCPVKESSNLSRSGTYDYYTWKEDLGASDSREQSLGRVWKGQFDSLG